MLSNKFCVERKKKTHARTQKIETNTLRTVKGAFAKGVCVCEFAFFFWSVGLLFALAAAAAIFLAQFFSAPYPFLLCEALIY